jgi:N-acyl-D-amino-acid deacylase
VLDLLIKSGTIIDGSGKNRYMGDIGIIGNRIIKIEKKIEDQSVKEINAEGSVVCPGFIDIHGHSDFTLSINNFAESKIRQGITTEVVGNCGFTAGPVSERYADELIQYLANTVVLSDTQKNICKWGSQTEFIDKIVCGGVSINLAPLVGHGTIRVAVMGFEQRIPNEKELNEMKLLLEQEMTQGIFGMSSGLEYEPGWHSNNDEIIELCKIISQYDGIYTTHMKNEGKKLIECINDSIEIGIKADVSVEISHLKAQYESNWGKVDEALELIEKAEACGVNIGFDVYPYIAFGSGLIDLMPPWVKISGPKNMIQLLKDNGVRNEVIKSMQTQDDNWENPMLIVGWDKRIKIAMLKTEQNKKYEGKTIHEISLDMKCTPFDVIIDLLITEEAAIKSIYFAMCEKDLIMIMKHPKAKFCTDGRAVDTYGELSMGTVHPRYYGTFPRIMGLYVREKQIFSLEEAIYKSTLLAAKKMKIKNRGELIVGNYADITVFNPDKIIDLATFEEPHRYSEGIEYVIVNGQIVISKGKHTGLLPGKRLKLN